MDAREGARTCLLTCLFTAAFVAAFMAVTALPPLSGQLSAEAAVAPPGLNTISGPITAADWMSGRLVVNGYTVYVRENSVLRSRVGGKEKKLTPLDLSVGDVVSVLAVPEGDAFVARIIELKPPRR
jgi:hypothetical protein